MIRELKERKEMTMMEAVKKFKKTHFGYALVTYNNESQYDSTIVPLYLADTDEEAGSYISRYRDNKTVLGVMRGWGFQDLEIGGVVYEYKE